MGNRIGDRRQGFEAHFRAPLITGHDHQIRRRGTAFYAAGAFNGNVLFQSAIAQELI